jgi:peptidoglycan/xylan/chitin deacetylase (PgdA/CDA1 family)
MVLVLCYHAVSDRWPAPLAVRPGRLEAQLRSLRLRGYHGATFYEAVSSPPAAKTMAVTFDDAFSSVLDLAFPILERAGVPGTVFVPTAFADGGQALRWAGIDHWSDGPYAPELTALTWAQLRALADAGWEIGSHTRTHPRLTQLDGAALATELERSRADCERGTGRPCRSLAYPYGDVDERVIEATRRAGYEVAAGLPARPGPPLPLSWPRVGVYHADALWRFSLKTVPRIWSLYAARRRRPAA